MTKIIAISNAKGGTGKTTTAVNLAHALALEGKNILLIDLDSQGSASIVLGQPPSPATYGLLVENRPLSELIVTARENLDLLASDFSLADVRDLLGVKAGRGRAVQEDLKKALAGKTAAYDFVLIDCSPGLDMLTVNALMAADDLMIPVSCDFLSAAGMGQHLETLEEIIDTGGKVRLRYVVPTMFDARTNRSRTILNMIKDRFGALVTTPIRTNTRIAESPHYGETIYEHDAKSSGASDYMDLAKRVLGNG